MYKYKVLPFKLTNGLATYRQYINNILFNYLNDFCIAYLNNIIIYSKDKLEYKGYVTVRAEGQQGNYNCVLLTNDVV